MDGENHGNPENSIKMDDLGGFPPIFRDMPYILEGKPNDEIWPNGIIFHQVT